jgi:orotate phosphoribosyltransferase
MLMKESEVLQYLSETGALLKGHFLLRSGLHSDQYFQGALLLQHTLIAAKLCAALAEPWQNQGIETVISPAIGGIVVGQEVGRALGVKAIFAEKDDNSNLLLRRGFTLKPGEKVLVAEDVVTKGGRVQQTIDLVRAHGAIPVGAATLIDRSAGSADFGIPFRSLLQLNLPTFEPENCPLCKQGLPIDKPGSK